MVVALTLLFQRPGRAISALHASIGSLLQTERGRIVKKGVIVLIVLLALVVIVSPGIIGKMAEQNINENLHRAAEQSGELVVTSTGFDRGWFSSEGEHRIELGQGGMRDAAMLARTTAGESDLPVLVINTRIDHGIVPISSLTRDGGALTPGLGSAVSTLRLEFGDDESVDIPGKIYSDVALNGDLTSNYLLEAGSHALENGTVEWQAGAVNVVVDASGERYTTDGEFDGLKLTGPLKNLSIGPVSFSANQHSSGYDYFVGDFAFETGAFDMGGIQSIQFAGFSVTGKNGIEGDRVVGDGVVSLDALTIPGLGDISYSMNIDSNADAAAFGRLIEKLESVNDNSDPDQMLASIDADAKDLVAAGLELNFSQFDVTLPMGKLESVIAFSMPEQDRDSFEWSSLLLKTKASIDLKVPAALIDMATSVNPQASGLIAAGYLVREGDVYIMDADMESGLLTINGAPIPIPAGMF